MPGDGFAFAVQVGGEEDVGAFLGEFFEFADDFAAAGEDLVFGGEGFEIDAHAFAGEIADVAHAGPDDVVVAEVLVDRLRLCGRFDDHEGFAVFLGH